MEGPQTRALADHLEGILAGQVVERIDVPANRWQANVMLLNCAGQVIQRVRSHGSWLFLDFSHGVTWMCHLLAKSTWRTRAGSSGGVGTPSVSAGRSATKSRKHKKSKAGPAPLLALTLRNGTVATLNGRPLFLISPTDNVINTSGLKGAGPDPLQRPFAVDDFLQRLRQATTRTVAAGLLDQRIVSGVGNPLKCEILFAARMGPDTRIASLYASDLEKLAHTVDDVAMRVYEHFTGSVPQAQLYRVYDRAGEPCVVCGAEIAVDRSGSDAHWTWYCPACQPLQREETLFA
jgi:formamidopyrimidine-DNA glycosylase